MHRRTMLLLTMVLTTVLFGVIGCGKAPDPKLAEDSKVQEAQAKVAYKILVPTFLPDRYALDGVKVDEKSNVALTFKGPENGSFVIDYAPGTVALTGPVEKVAIKDFQAQYLEQNGTRKLAWQTADKATITIITGSLDRSSMLALARSMAR